MRPHRKIGSKAILLVAVSFFSARAAAAQGWQPPPEAKTYREERIPLAGGKTLKVVFYSRGWEASATVVSPQGQELATVCMDLNLGFREPTGIHHLKNDDSWQAVLFGQVGAKAHEGKVFDLREGKLVQVFDWSGWSFRIVPLAGKQVIEAQTYEYHSLTDLYLWRNGRFQQVNQEYPGFYAAEIKRLKGVIRKGNEPFAGIFADACQMVAQALLYSRHYAEAVQLCQEALEATRTRCCPGTSAPPESVAAADAEARKRIAATIDQILAAQQRGSKVLGT